MMSQAIPNRGDTSFQFGTSLTSANDRNGTKLPGATSRAGIEPLNHSKRTPGLMRQPASTSTSPG